MSSSPSLAFWGGLLIFLWIFPVASAAWMIHDAGKRGKRRQGIYFALSQAVLFPFSFFAYLVWRARHSRVPPKEN